MQTTADPLAVLYVTDGPDQTADIAGADGLRVAVTSSADRDSWPAPETVDCLLVGCPPDGSLSGRVERLRRSYPSTPLVAFAGTGQADIESVLEAGASDVIQSDPANTADALVRHRVESVSGSATSGTGRTRDTALDTDLLARFSEHLQDVIWVCNRDADPHGSVEYISETYETVWGRPREHALQGGSEAFIETVHPDDRDRVLAATRDRPFDTYEITYRIRRPDGETRWIHDRTLSVSESGGTRRVVGIARDITDRKRRERALERQNDLFAKAQDIASVGAWEFTVDSDTENIWTEQVYDIFDAPADSRQTLDEVRQFYHPEDWPTIREAVDRAVSTGEPFDMEVRLDTDGAEDRARWVRLRGDPQTDNGSVVRIRGTVQDITERRKHEHRLETQRDQLARLDRLNRTIRSVHAALVGAQTSEDVAQAVCDRLSELGSYPNVLVFRRGGSGLTLQAHCDGRRADASDGAVSVPADAPVRRALETGEPCAVGDLAEDDVPTVVDYVDGIQTDVVASVAAVPLSYDGHTSGVLAVCADRDSTFTDRELDALAELGGTVGYANAAVESREREATLASLYEATQDLLTAQSTDAVCETVVETAASVLDLPGIGIFTFDDEANALTLATGTDRIETFFDEVATFGPNHADSITWQTYVTGERRFLEDVHESAHLANTDTDAQSSLFLPLGEHGVFVVASSERVHFGEQKRRLVGLLAATTRAALDRVAGRESIRERDRRLSEHTERLASFRRQFDLLKAVEETLGEAGTRPMVERGVCEQVVDRDQYGFAWVGSVPTDGDCLDPRVWANGETGRGQPTEQAYLDGVSLALDSAEPAVRAATTGEPVVVSNVTTALHEADWARTALEHGYQSVLAVPLVCGEVTYGVLAVYATTTDAFDDIARPALTTLGDRTARAINAVECERAALTGRAVEVTLAVPERDRVPNVVAATVDEPVEYCEMAPTRDGRSRVLFTVPASSVPAVHDLRTSLVGVESVDVCAVEGGNRATVRLTLAGRTLAATLLECGALPGNMTATADETTVTVRLPREFDVRTFLDRLREYYPRVEVRSQQTVETSAAGAADVRRVLDDDLTDRQREVLRTAYESGFFESPRETSGVELADRLDVSQPTVAHHLRAAQRRLLDSVLGD